MFPRLGVALVLSALLVGCGFDTQGLRTGSDLGSDARAGDDALFPTLDGAAGDDAAPPPDTSLADASTPDAQAGDTLVLDTALADTREAAVDAGPPFCDATDATLVACYRFEGDTKDESAYHNDLTATGVTYVAGISGRALSLSPTASVKAPDTASFAVTNALTIELWVRPRTLPTSGRVGLMDDDGRFGLFAYAPGIPRAMSPTALDAPSALPIGVFTHVAFTYDGATMILYVNGAPVATKAIVGTFGAPSGSGVAVGMNSPSGDVLDGELDSLRVFRVARSAAEIAASATAKP